MNSLIGTKDPDGVVRTHAVRVTRDP